MSLSVQKETAASNSDEDEISIGGGKKRGKQAKTPATPSKKSAGKKRFTPTDPEWPKDVPDTYNTCEKDWKNILKQVMHQGDHEVCWAVALTRNIETTLSINGNFVNLSAQHLINNIKVNRKGAVTKYDEIATFLVKNGLVTEEECKYTGEIKQSCSHTTQVTKIKELKEIENAQLKEDEIIKLVERGPVAAVMDLYRTLLNFKGDGIYYGHDRKEKSIGRHMVLVIGYGTTDDGIHYWIIQNSWGVGWGEEGFGKIIRQCSGKNKDSLFVQVLYPVV